MSFTNEIIINNIKEYLKYYNKSTISISDLYEIVAINTGISKKDLCSIEYATFHDIVLSLITTGAVSKRGKGSNSRGNMSLSNNYNNLMKEKKKILSEDDKLFLHGLNSNMDVTSYFKNVDKFNEDKEKLKKLSDFLNNDAHNAPYICINERSYELFGYEKELVNGNSGLLKRVKVTLDNLKCIESYTPIQCYILKNFYTKERRTILIIENCDTYRSFLLAAKDTILGDLIDMIIFGGGNKITGNFKQHTMYSITNMDRIYYFGDIDPEGLHIFKRVKYANKELNIQLSNELYKLAIKIGKEKGINDINNKNQSMPSEEEVNHLLSDLEDDVAKDFKDIIYSGKYIPQEAVNYNTLLTQITYKANKI